MATASLRPGDKVLLFHRLPVEFQETTPVSLGPGVQLELTPFDILRGAVPPAKADLVLPGCNVPHYPNAEYCFVSPASNPLPAGLSSANALFLSLAALRLRAPVGMEVAGQFEVVTATGEFEPRALHELVTSWQPADIPSYSAEDLRACGEIARRVIEVAERRYDRLISSYVFFAQVTNGFSLSFQACYMSLFAALEGLFVPRGNYAETLARRIARFLEDFDDASSLQEWVAEEYRRGRGELAHGVQEVSPWKGLRPERATVIGNLHEITRLSILGFLGLEDGFLAQHSTMSGPPLQRLLDGLSAACGRHLDGCRIWAA